MKIMTGVFAADPGGDILIDEKPVTIRDPLHARGLGLFHHLSGTVDGRRTDRRRKHFSRAGAAQPLVRFDRRGGNELRATPACSGRAATVSPPRAVRELSVGQKQMVEIAKALSLDARILVMDEPTASLSPGRAGHTVRDHPPAHARRHRRSSTSRTGWRRSARAADRVTVLRDGRYVGDLPIEEVDARPDRAKMVDRESEPVLRRCHPVYGRRRRRRFRSGGWGSQVCAPHGSKVEDIDFDLHKGEILGFFGFVGSRSHRNDGNDLRGSGL